LGGLTFVSFVGYLQFQYAIFGDRNEYAFLVSSVVLFAAAYYFDHAGILSMAITTAATYAGISVAPSGFLEIFDRSLSPLVFAGLAFGSFLIAGGWYLSYQEIKKHFTFTYYNFGVNIFFVFALTGLFNFNIPLFLVLLALIATLTFLYSISMRSFYFLLLGIIYCYIGVSYLLLKLFFEIDNDEGAFFVTFFYFIASSIAIIFLLKSIHRKFKNV
jgi:hypothetical protein